MDESYFTQSEAEYTNIEDTHQLTISDYFHVTPAHYTDKPISASNHPGAILINHKFLNGKDILTKMLTYPAVPASQFLLQQYEPHILLYSRFKKVNHILLGRNSQLSNYVEERKTIGLIDWEGEIVGCALLHSLINPIPNYLSDMYSIDDIAQKEITLTSPQSLNEFVSEGAVASNYFETIQLRPDFLELLKGGHVYKDIYDEYKIVLPNMVTLNNKNFFA